MKNLNAEQIKKALEEMNMVGVNPIAIRKAIALITSQEQRIKELTEEYESMAKSVNEASDLIRKLRADKEELTEQSKNWEQAYDCMDSACRELSDKCDRLTEENERLSQSLANVSQSLANSKAENKRLKLEYAGFKAGAKDAVSFVKAETVRKMQERLIAEIEQTPNANEHFIKAWKSKIDQIAKEMLEKTECTQIIRYPTLYEALEDIIWYDNHSDWLKKLCVNIEKAKEEGHNFSEFHFDEWHTEKHTIWMLLVGMFGDWGTSIRSGWIEKHDECIAFINNITKNSLEES